MRAVIKATKQKITVIKVINDIATYVPDNISSQIFTIPVNEIEPIMNTYRFTILRKGGDKPIIDTCVIEAKDLTEALIQMGVQCCPYFGETYLLSEVEESE